MQESIKILVLLLDLKSGLFGVFMRFPTIIIDEIPKSRVIICS
jgi:hypothetical protein